MTSDLTIEQVISETERLHKFAQPAAELNQPLYVTWDEYNEIRRLTSSYVSHGRCICGGRGLFGGIQVIVDETKAKERTWP